MGVAEDWVPAQLLSTSTHLERSALIAVWEIDADDGDDRRRLWLQDAW